jgi:hypothetical protein
MRRFAALLALAAIAFSGMTLARPTPATAGILSVAVNDSYGVRHDRTLSVTAPGVLANDVDVDLLGGTRVSLSASPTHGRVTLQSNGAFTYTPNAGYVGSDSFRYRISGLLTTPATVTLNVTNVAPIARADSYSFAVGRTLAVPAPGVLANDLDADGDTLSASEVGGISGSLDLRSDGSFTYSPNGGFSGSATFTYRVSDGISSSTAIVTLTATAATPAPTASLTPTPTPRPTPTPVLSVPSLPVPSLPLPSIAVPSTSIPPLPLPSLGPIAPLPTLAVPTPTSRPTLSPGPSATVNSASPTPSPGQPTAPPSLSPAVIARGGNGAGGGSAGDPTSAGPLPVAIGPGGVGVRWSPSGDSAGLGVLSLDGLELGQLWLVPAALVGTSGLLVILWVVLQLVAGGIWLPAARRLRGEDRPRAQIIVRV